MTLYPTHTCFDDALDMLAQAVKANPGSYESDELRLVHAVCVAPDGAEYSHAWVESNGTHVWFEALTNGHRVQYVSDLGEFYAEYQVKETTKYTPPQAWAENKKHETYGPWIDRYKLLCGNDHKTWGPVGISIGEEADRA